MACLLCGSLGCQLLPAHEPFRGSRLDAPPRIYCQVMLAGVTARAVQLASPALTTSLGVAFDERRVVGERRAATLLVADASG